jgi:TrmH family RNA methyltransferase
LRVLLRDKRAREEHGEYVAEGPRVVEAALDRGAPVTAVYLRDDASATLRALADRAKARGATLRELSHKVGDTKTPQPIFALIRLERPAIDAVLDADLSVLVECVNDPGNAGTLIRSAAANGAGAIVFGSGSVDIHNPKVVRASAGACFALPAFEDAAPVTLLEALGARGVQRLAGVPRGGEAPETFDLTQPTCLVLGHETHGLDPTLPVDGVATIPMHAAESINLAMAGTVLLAEAARQRRAR